MLFDLLEDKTTSAAFFASPVTGRPLHVAENPLRLYNDAEEFKSEKGVLLFLERQNEEYEGSYLNKIKYVPKTESVPHTIPLWMIANGYLWEVRKQFSKGDTICELGCASGVNYFGSRFNMVGVDFSLRSLQGIENYAFKIQANALKLPFKSGSLDGVISSYFWEHIDPKEKPIMLEEFYRVLKPGGKVIMLYDVETENQLVELLKKRDLKLYQKLFLEKDYHIGYETLDENNHHFTKAGFRIVKSFGMERTFFQSSSVYIKMADIPTWYGRYSKLMTKITSSRLAEYANIFFVRLIDVTVGKLLPEKRSRIAISVLIKEQK